MCLVSPPVFNDCTAEHERGRISTGTSKAHNQKPGVSLSREGWAGQDSGKERHF